MYDLATFSLDDLERLTSALQEHTAAADSLEAAGQLLCQHLLGHVLVLGEPCVALARFYTTLPRSALDEDLRRVSADLAAGSVTDDTTCLVLLGTAGIEPDWNDRRRSKGHAAIPLQDAAAVERSPMIATLFRDLGVDAVKVVEFPAYDRLHHRNVYGVFYVEDARNNRAIPDQQFVRDYGIGSVVGLGGFLPTGELFALILFLTTRIPGTIAQRLTAAAATLRTSLAPLAERAFE